MLRISQINVAADGNDCRRKLYKKASEILHLKESEIQSLKIVRRSIDARRKPDIYYSYVIDVEVAKQDKVYKRIKNNQVSIVNPIKYTFPQGIPNKLSPVIVGTGPAGLFCGYYLAKAGFSPILLERGASVEERMQDVEGFWLNGILKPDSNVQFGEGGAGTFSDGKLNTLVKDKDGRNQEVLKTFVEFGASDTILYDAKPHIGTDVLCHIVKQMRQEIIRLGGSVRFHSKVTDIIIENQKVTGVVINEKERLYCRQVVLAIGHSARDTFDLLYRKQIPMEAKAFAVGFRVEHLQAMINKNQYSMEKPEALGAASYKVAAKTSTGRGVYSFCMCPGGYVVNASSEPGRLAVNGMSYSKRDGINANSAIIVAVSPNDFGSSHPLAGIAFQRSLEERAYKLGNGFIPVQHYGDFCRSIKERQGLIHSPIVKGGRPKPFGMIEPQSKGNYVYTDISSILPQECNIAFIEGMSLFGNMIPGFDSDEVLLSGVESRTSSPVRIPRDDTLQTKIKGIYPCGEGAGYAGGITSAAMDGIRAAEAIVSQLD